MLPIVGAALAATSGLRSAEAATITWTGAGNDNDLLNGANWSSGIAPALSGDALIFNGAARLSPTLSANRSVASLTFSSTASAFTLGGIGVYTLTASSGLVNNSTSNTQTINNALVFGNNQTWSTNAGSLVLNGNIDNGGQLLTVSSSGTTTVNGILGGSGGLTKSSTGTLVLTGANTYSGVTTLSGGNVNVGSNSAFGTGTLKFNSAALVVSATGGDHTLANTYSLNQSLVFAGTDSLTLTGAGSFTKNRKVTVNGAGVLTMSGNLSASTNRYLTKDGAGTLILSGANSIASVTLSAGTLYAGNTTALGSGTFSLGTANFGTTGALTMANAVSLNGNATFIGSSAFTFTGAAALTATRGLTFNGGAPVTFNGVVSGAGFGMTKSGSGTLILGGTGANTYSGLTQVSDGQLTLAKTAGTNAFAGALQVGDGNGLAGSAVVQLNASNQIASGAVSVYADAQFSLQSFSDTTSALTLYGGSITGTGSLGLGGNLTFSGTNGNSAVISSGLNMTAARTLLINSNGLSGVDVTVSGPLTGAFAATKTGLGTLLLSGSNTFSGGYLANDGTTLLGSSTALGSAAANLGDTAGTTSASLLFHTTSGLTVANALTVRSGNTGTSTLGGLNTTGINTFSGGVTLNKSVTFTAETGGEVAFTGAITGTGGFTKIGAGTIRLSGSNSSSGTMLVSAGTLALGASNALGSGALTVDGGIVDFGASRTDSVGTLIVDNGGSITGSGTSTLTSTGNFDVRSGIIQVALAGAGNLTKSTAGSITLSGASVYTGTTTVSAGSLLLGIANALPTSTVLSISTGALLDLKSFTTQAGSLAGAGDIQLGTATLNLGGLNTSTTFSGTINGSGGLTKSGIGTFTLSGSNTYSGATTVTGGTLLLGKSGALNPLTAVIVNTPSTFSLGAFSQAVGSLAGSGAVSMAGGTFTVGAAGTSTSFSGIISGSGAWVKSGAGTLTLTGANTATASLEVAAGTVSLGGASGSTVSVPTITLDSGGLLQLDNSVTENANRIGNSTTIRLGGGSLQLISDSNGTNESVGSLSVAGGSSTVNVTHNGGISTASILTFSGLGTVANGATVNFTATGGVLGVASTGPQIYITGQATGLLGGWATVGADPAEYYTNGIRAYSAYYEGALGINVNDGTKIVRLSSASVSGASILTNAGVTTDLGLNLTDIATVDLSTDSTRTLNLLNGSLIKSTAINSFIQGLGHLTAGGTAAANLNVSVTSDSYLTISSVITNNSAATVGLTKGDLGTLTLSGANTFTGNVFANGGILSISSENNLGSGTKDVNFNGGTLQISSNLNLSNTKTFRIAAGLTGTVDVAALQTLTLANTAGMLVTTDTAGTFIKTGAGSLVIQNADAGFTGTMRVDQGTTELRNSASLGSGLIQLNGGTLALSQNVSTTFSNSVTMLADSTLRVSRTSGTGNVIHTIAGLDLGSRTLNITGDGFGSLQISTLTLSGTGVLNPTTADIRAGAIGGSFDLTKTGSGALVLTAASTYTGSTVINGGTLRLASANVIPDASAISLASGTTFDLAGFSDTVGSLAGAGNVSLGSATLSTGAGASSTYSGVISGTGTLTKTGAGTTFTLSGANTYSGPTLVSAGILAVSGVNRLSTATDLTVSSGATFLLNGNDTTAASLAGGGTVSLGSGIFTTGTNSSTFSGLFTGTGGLTKSGAGILTLSGNSTYAGATTIQSGSVVMRSSAALGTGSVAVSSGSNLALENNLSVGSKSLSLAGTGISGGGALVNNSGANSWAGSLNLAAASTVTSTAGSLTMSGAIDFATSPLTVNGSGTTILSGNVSGTAISATTSLIKSGTGTLTLSGNNTYTGVTTVSQGTLMADNTAALGATGVGNGTTVADGATVLLQSVIGVSIGNEDLTVTGTGVGGNGVLRSQSGENSWNGTLTLAGDSTLRVDAGSILHLNGAVAESGGVRGITLDGGGTLILSGAATNSGPTLIVAGTLQLAASDRLNDVSQVNVSSGGTFDLNNSNETIGSLVGAGSVNLGTDINLGGGDLTTGGDNTSVAFSGIISGLGSIFKTGTGTQTLSGSNTYTGVTTVSAGVLSASTLANGGSNSSIGASTNVAANLVLSGGTLRYTGAAQSTDRDFTLDLAGGTFDASGSGALTLAGAATLTGIDAARTLTITGTNTGSNTLAAALTDNGLGLTSLVKSGTGTWVLSGASSYTGSTTIAGGILRLGSAGRIGDSSGVVISSGATFDLNGFSETVGSLAGGGGVTLGTAALTFGADNTSPTFSGVITGSGPVTKTGTGSEIFSGANSYTGITTISGGTLSVAALANGALNSGIGASTNAAANLVLNGGALRYTGSAQSTDRNYTIGTAGGTFDASGSGALTLAGSATFSGTNTARTLTLAGTNTGNNTFAASLADNGNGKTSLLKSDTGTWVLTGASTFTGTTTITAGTLEIGAGGLTGSLSGTSVTNNGTLNYNRSDDFSVAYSTGGTGSLVKKGPGKLTLTSANTYTGPTTVSGGTLSISSTGSLGAGTTAVASGTTLQNNGSIAGAVTVNGGLTGSGSFGGQVIINTTDSPGNGIGTQTFSSGIRLNAASSLYWELKNNTSTLGLAGTDYDQLQVTGGALEVASGASLNLVFNMVSSGVDFSNVFWSAGRTWSIAALSGAGIATAGNASFLLGTISKDSLGHSYNTYGSFSTNITGGNEVLTWTAIPEPRSLGLWTLGGLLLLRRRKRS